MKQSVQHMQLWTNEANSTTTNTIPISESLPTSNLSEAVETEHEVSHSSTHSPTVSNSSTTSSIYLKERTTKIMEQNDSDNPEEISTSPKPSTSGLDKLAISAAAAVVDSMNGGEEDKLANGGPLECLHCGIFFFDKTLFFLHKGLHSEKDVWRCNLCGVDCNEKYTFNSHMISAKHG